MKIIPDTNVLIRAAMGDDEAQAEAAHRALASADLVAVGLISICEFAWVLGRGYKATNTEVANAIRVLVASDKILVDRLAVEAGLSMLDAGGDFADGVIAHEGAELGGDVFVSFDQKAVSLLKRREKNAGLLT